MDASTFAELGPTIALIVGTVLIVRSFVQIAEIWSESASKRRSTDEHIADVLESVSLRMAAVSTSLEPVASSLNRLSRVVSETTTSVEGGRAETRDMSKTLTDEDEGLAALKTAIDRIPQRTADAVSATLADEIAAFRTATQDMTRLAERLVAAADARAAQTPEPGAESPDVDAAKE